MHTDNEYLLNLDMISATKEQKIVWLNRIIDNELAKQDEKIDDDLVSECSDYLEELTADNIPCDNAELCRILDKIKDSTKNQSKKVVTVRENKFHINLIAIVAAALLLFVTTVTVAASANGYSSAWDYVSKNVKILLELEPGETISEGSMEIIKGYGSTEYSSVKKLLKQENLNILYPGALPKGVKVKQIIKYHEEDSKYILVFILSSDKVSFSIKNYNSINLEVMEVLEIYETEHSSFYIQIVHESYYMAVSQNQGFEYCITAGDYNDLITVLDDLKKAE